MSDSKDLKETDAREEKPAGMKRQDGEKAEASPGKKADEPASKKEAPGNAAKGVRAPAARAIREGNKPPARAGAKGAKAVGRKPEKPLEPSPKQPLLDDFVKRITQQVGKEAVEESYINRPNGHLPTIVINNVKWHEAARVLRDDEALSFDYLVNMSGVDHEDHMEVVYHLESLSHKNRLCVRVKTGREEPSVPSVTDIWAGADWDEREIYDLLGIQFPGHPNLERIFLPESWVGHPLRKDYEPIDSDI